MVLYINPSYGYIFVQFFADTHSMDEIINIDLEHLTDIGRIVMEKILSNSNAKSPDFGPPEPQGLTKLNFIFRLIVKCESTR